MIKRLLRWVVPVENSNYIPGVVQVSITSRCQCSCKHCGVSLLKDKHREEPTIDELDSIFKNICNAGTKVVDLFGGEPTIRKDIFRIVELAKSYGLITIVETNGFLLEEPYVAMLKQSQIDQIYLSLDYYQSELHDANRGLNGLFNRAVTAISLCRKYSIPIDVSFVPESEHYFKNHINKFLAFVFDKGANNVRILLPRFTGSMHLTSSSPFSNGNEQELISYILPEYIDKIYFHSQDTPLDDISVCSAKKYFCHIMTNGDVLPCPYLPLVFGNIKKESLGVIFHRIQTSEIMKSGGMHCLARDIEFVKTTLSRITPDKPYIKMHES